MNKATLALLALILILVVGYAGAVWCVPSTSTPTFTPWRVVTPSPTPIPPWEVLATPTPTPYPTLDPGMFSTNTSTTVTPRLYTFKPWSWW